MTPIEIARLEACQRLEASVLTQTEVARHLALSERQVRRLLARYRSGGPGGLSSRRRGRPSNRRLPEVLLQRALDLVRERYADFGPTFANEKLRELHGILVGTETLRKAMIAAGLWKAKKKPRRRVHPPRERRPCFGELVQIDGSPHDWFEGRGSRCSLIVFIDDATSALVGLRFVKVESTWAYLDVLREYIRTFGRPLTLYSDRHSIFRSVRDETTITKETQLGQALRELDIELLCASTPQAKGRVERANRTLQQRLVREMRLHDIGSMDAANAFLPGFIQAHNDRFAVAPRCSDDLHRSADAWDLQRTLCCRYERVVSSERMFQLGQHIYAIDDPNIKPKTRLSIREQQDGAFEALARGLIVPFHKIRSRTQGAIVDSKAIREPVDRHVPNPQKAHTPPMEHPWKSYTYRLAQLSKADIST